MAFTISGSHRVSSDRRFVTNENSLRKARELQRKQLQGVEAMRQWWAGARPRMRRASVRSLALAVMVSTLAGLGGLRPGQAADSVEAFYKGKTMQLLIG